VFILLSSGCGECGRRLFFYTIVTDSADVAVAAATVVIDCVDVHDGAHLLATGTTEQSGAVMPAVEALGRDCPENPEAHASYFETCLITVEAAGFREESRLLSGDELDALPEVSVGQAGHGVQVAFMLTQE
jgi:hypothetical protein